MNLPVVGETAVYAQVDSANANTTSVFEPLSLGRNICMLGNSIFANPPQAIVKNAFTNKF
ncbi:MAG: hypothetical protein GY943_12115 [Chloroflexi bacterium]|nr:hypothetical protein [Chloroflexota bacterium]